MRNILVENQYFEIAWNNSNRKWFESLGYGKYKRGEKINVRAEDLTHSSKTEVKVICDYCNESYDTSFAVYYKGHEKFPKDCCSKCAGKKTSEVSFIKRREKAWKQLEYFCKEKNYKLITQKEEYTDIHMKIKYLCPKHGEKTGTIDNMIHGHGCIDCKNEEMVYIMQYDKNYIEEFINSINGNKLLNKDDYINIHLRNLNIKCKCGNVYTTSFSNYKNHYVRQCLSCSCKHSKYESYITSILQNMNIEFIPEKRFTDCRDIKPLPFDFYLQNYNLIIEYDGEGHYLESFYEFRSDNPREALLNRQRKDEIKNKYCKEHKIHILRIPYWEQDNIKAIILDKLNSLKNIKTN